MSWNVVYTPSSSVFLGIVLIISVLALTGLSIGYVLAEVVKGRHMAIGSAVYWAIYFVNWYNREFLAQIPAIYPFSIRLLYSGALVLFLTLAYAIRKYTLKRNV